MASHGDGISSPNYEMDEEESDAWSWFESSSSFPLETSVDSLATSTSVGIEANDVVLGKSKQAFAQPGNEMFRTLIRQHCVAYKSSDCRRTKQEIARGILEQIQSSGGRFLKLQPDGTVVVLLINQCHEKISHALRSAARTRNKKKK